MADRRKPVTKKPDEILDSVFTGHEQAVLNGRAKAFMEGEMKPKRVKTINLSKK